jgi:DnaJ-class molecular chaperone
VIAADCLRGFGERSQERQKQVWDRDWQAEIRLLQKCEQRAREILGVPAAAGMEEIKRAWRREGLKHHPDRNGGSPESHRRFILITCAYRFLIEGVGCDQLDTEEATGPSLTDGKYRRDNPWGYFAWWRETYF